jgi:dienelactone hydrolase
MRYLAAMIFTLLVPSAARAALVTRDVDYQQGETALQGYLAYDDAVKGKRPGVMIVHEWWGVNDYVKGRARQLADLGYVAFAADIYGKGVRATTMQEAQQASAPFRTDRALLRARARAGLEVLRKHELVDPKRIAAIGYCFGGMTVLELARSGADVAGVVSFHGGLGTPNPEDAKNIKAKVLVLHGGDDPNVPPEQVLAFQDEMRKAKVDWQMVIYGGAVHSFTNPASGNDPSRGAAYNEKADRRSWEAMRVFFAEIFREREPWRSGT